MVGDFHSSHGIPYDLRKRSPTQEIPNSQTSSGDLTNSYKVGPEPINGVMRL